MDEHIQELGPTEVFVFGSNTGGIHGRGAARQAYRDFRAEWGVGEGLTGQCYALPTLQFGKHAKSFSLEKRGHTELETSVKLFLHVAAVHPELTFLLTRVGCGLAGYAEDYMKSFFVKVPCNVLKPEGW